MKYIYRTQLSVYNMKSSATVAPRDDTSVEMTEIEEQEGARAGRHKVVGAKISSPEKCNYSFNRIGDR